MLQIPNPFTLDLNPKPQSLNPQLPPAPILNPESSLNPSSLGDDDDDVPELVEDFEQASQQVD